MKPISKTHPSLEDNIVLIEEFKDFEGNITLNSPDHSSHYIWWRVVRDKTVDKAVLRKKFNKCFELDTKPKVTLHVANEELQEMGVNTTVKRTTTTYFSKKSIIEFMKELGLEEE